MKSTAALVVRMVCYVLGVLVLFVSAFRYALGEAESGNDPGAWVMVVGLPLLLLMGVAAFCFAIWADRTGWWDR